MLTSILNGRQKHRLYQIWLQSARAKAWVRPEVAEKQRKQISMLLSKQRQAEKKLRKEISDTLQLKHELAQLQDKPDEETSEVLDQEQRQVLEEEAGPPTTQFGEKIKEKVEEETLGLIDNLFELVKRGVNGDERENFDSLTFEDIEMLEDSGFENTVDTTSNFE